MLGSRAKSLNKFPIGGPSIFQININENSPTDTVMTNMAGINQTALWTAPLHTVGAGLLIGLLFRIVTSTAYVLVILFSC